MCNPQNLYVNLCKGLKCVFRVRKCQTIKYMAHFLYVGLNFVNPSRLLGLKFVI